MNEGDIECGVGEVALTLSGSETDYAYNIDCGIGEVTVGGRSFSGIGVSRSEDDFDDNDDHHGEEHHGGKELSVECGIGSVSINFK